jgi:ABC-2 type transport system ATP-binding protein
VDEAKTVTAQPPEEDVVLRVEDVTKEFSGTRVLDRISFELRRGEVLGFLGPNGAGKTTTMRILTGFFPPNKGKVWVRDEELFRDPRRLKRFIGYLPETVMLYTDMRVKEFLEFVADVKGVRRSEKRKHIEEKLSQCGLWEVRGRLIGKLSKGFRQRVGLAQALLGDPEILVLDEPTSGLDPKQIIEIRNLIQELGKEKTLILSTHILPEVSMVCDRVLIINHGKVIASGTTEELESGLRDRHEILVTIGDNAKKDEAMTLFTGVPGVERVQVLYEKEGQVCLTLGIAKGKDLRSEISRLCVQHDIPLLEMRSSHLSLEEIFMKIVVNEPGQGFK